MVHLFRPPPPVHPQPRAASHSYLVVAWVNIFWTCTSTPHSSVTSINTHAKGATWRKDIKYVHYSTSVRNQLIATLIAFMDFIVRQCDLIWLESTPCTSYFTHSLRAYLHSGYFLPLARIFQPQPPSLPPCLPLLPPCILDEPERAVAKIRRTHRTKTKTDGRRRGRLRPTSLAHPRNSIFLSPNYLKWLSLARPCTPM